MTDYMFTSHASFRSGLARVTLAGELDLDTAPYVQEAVTACLEQQPVSLCLDLTGVSFCDCAGLSALFRARTAALHAGVDLVVEGIGTQLARLLSLIGADDVFTPRMSSTDVEAFRCVSGAVTLPPGAEAAAVAELSLPDLLA
ncbi:STAS domain-containing protein [Streptomyces cyaneofuscatus]|uniref:STAS domain-containing protein n=1 Tax=Streptomyces cyaneofuscatus TaxID=66883 RepID=UPI0036AF6FAF